MEKLDIDKFLQNRIDYAVNGVKQLSPFSSNTNSNHIHQIIPGSPLIFGPGTWWLIHLKSYLTDSEDKIEEFYDFLYTIVYNIPCPMCRGNAINYIHTNDGSKYLNKRYNGRHIGMLMWMVDFHNDVNKRNNKELVSRNNVFTAYGSKHPEHHPLIPESPLIFGPGAWWVLHLLSYTAKDIVQIKRFINFLTNMIPRIPCPMCRHNAERYLSNNGRLLADKITYDDREVGLFVWIGDMHNDVNQRNGYSSIDWKNAYDTYKDVYNQPDRSNLVKINKLISKLKI